tara:strand:+ start:288 stop:686 length:399 start_codon:yes stop_codon:yes gene_type:complete
MVNIKKDLQFGLAQEDKVLSILQTKINKNIIKTSQFHPFDYFCDNIYYELKTRRNKHDTYNDTMCGYNKLTFAKENPQYTYMFIFNFTDGLYYHNWIKDKWYNVKISGRSDRGKLELQEYFYINKKDLLILD